MPKPLRIVIADDHPLFREGVAHSLNLDADIEVVGQAGNAEEAVAMVRQLRPDLVLLDISMPEMGGVAAARQIAVEGETVRIVMLTVSEDRDNLIAALKAGAHGYVLKGVSASELRSIVHRVASGEAYITSVLAAALLVEFTRPPARDPLAGLTEREITVLKLVGQGLTNREIGERLHLAEKTVKHYMTAILQKLHLRSRTEAALFAVRADLSAHAPADSPVASNQHPKQR